MTYQNKILVFDNLCINQRQFLYLQDACHIFGKKEVGFSQLIASSPGIKRIRNLCQ